MNDFKTLAAVFLAFLSFSSVLHAATLQNEYSGVEKCIPCHEEIYEEWAKTGHARILTKSSEERVSSVPFPDGYSAEGTSYVIGGYKWKVLFLDKNGYLITSTPEGPGKNQYNVRSQEWVDYRPGEKVIYDCGKCHATGYSSEGHQGGLEGIKGTWKFEGVQCEACHGPGALHVRSSIIDDIVVNEDICVQCHGTEPLNEVPVHGDFLAAYSEINQLLKSEMQDFSCVTCHNPHRFSEISITNTCESCHEEVSVRYKDSYMYEAGIKCIDCHMPPAGVVAEGDSDIYLGDLKSHLFKIDHTGEFPVLTKEGENVNAGFLSVDYACKRCHNIYGSREWAASYAMSAHKIKITTNIKIMRLQMVFASIGFFFALLSFMSAMVFKNWLKSPFNKNQMLSLHRNSVWITFFIYVFVATLCTYFHFPISDPSKALGLGWFLIHPVNGVMGIVLYAGKSIAVRKMKKGWAVPGSVWGIGIFIFWIIQYTTVILAYFRILRV